MTNTPWKYLTEKPGSSSKQLVIVGTRIMASAVWSSMLSNKLDLQSVADEFGIDIEAAKEAIEYSERNSSLIHEEADISRLRLARFQERNRA